MALVVASSFIVLQDLFKVDDNRVKGFRFRQM